ncbi:hypothetical protein [Bernardetia sp.]|uniref:hypothetical protein n=1 Tax=Bernardetia sp. TaxID=1937974 RepID=UPI0025C12774|nr:hypothetical protein [Bernardetia sp.]
MNKQHCEQAETLENVPVLETKLVASKNQLIAELLNTGIEGEFVMRFTSVLFFVSIIIITLINENYYATYPENQKISFIYVFFIVFGAIIFSSIISTLPQLRFLTGNHPDDIRILKTHIELGKELYVFLGITQIKYKRTTNTTNTTLTYNDDSKPYLSVHFTNGRYVEHSLPTSDYKTISRFLIKLGKVSYFTKLSLYSDNKNEYETIKHIKQNSNGDIVVEEPAYLVNSN